jgi:hypothetical protein
VERAEVSADHASRVPCGSSDAGGSPPAADAGAYREALSTFGKIVAKHDPAIFARHWPTLAAAFHAGAAGRDVVGVLEAERDRANRYREKYVDEWDRRCREARAYDALLVAARNAHAYHRCPAATGGTPCDLCVALLAVAPAPERSGEGDR